MWIDRSKALQNLLHKEQSMHPTRCFALSRHIMREASVTLIVQHRFAWRITTQPPSPVITCAVKERNMLHQAGQDKERHQALRSVQPGLTSDVNENNILHDNETDSNKMSDGRRQRQPLRYPNACMMYFSSDVPTPLSCVRWLSSASICTHFRCETSM